MVYENGLQDAAHSLDALLYDRTYTVPELIWLTDPDVPFRSVRREVGACVNGMSNNFFPHLHNSLHLLARDREAV